MAKPTVLISVISSDLTCNRNLLQGIFQTVTNIGNKSISQGASNKEVMVITISRQLWKYDSSVSRGVDAVKEG